MVSKWTIDFGTDCYKNTDKKKLRALCICSCYFVPESICLFITALSSLPTFIILKSSLNSVSFILMFLPNLIFNLESRTEWRDYTFHPNWTHQNWDQWGWLDTQDWNTGRYNSWTLRVIWNCFDSDFIQLQSKAWEFR